jgi:hypothetical protein
MSREDQIAHRREVNWVSVKRRDWRRQAPALRG